MDMLAYERQAWARGYRRVAGVDEAGRGPLAGPVVAAAVVVGRSFLESDQAGLLRECDDSKKLSASRRASLFAFLEGCTHVEMGVGVVAAPRVDGLNILRATHVAMASALRALSALPDYALVDGLSVPGLPCASRSIVKGDAKSVLIAASSIVAKVTRDRMMESFEREYPGYGFAAHKGYGTRAHLAALVRLGPCAIHRRSFRPVRELTGECAKPLELWADDER